MMTEKSMGFCLMSAENVKELYAENERLKKQLGAAERLISTMKNNKKAALWLRARNEWGGNTNG